MDNDEYFPEVLTDTKKPAEKSTLTWKQRYDRMKKHYGWNDADVAEITGNTAKSINAVVNMNRDFPRWLRLAIVVFEIENNLREHTVFL